MRRLAAVRYAALLAVAAAGCGGSTSPPFADALPVKDGRVDSPLDSPGADRGDTLPVKDAPSDFRFDGPAEAGGDARVDADASGDAGVDAPVACVTEMNPVSVSSFQESFERQPTPFRVRAAVRPARTTDVWVWKVVDPQGVVVPTKPVGDDSALIEFLMQEIGVYALEASIPTRSECPTPRHTQRVIDPRPAAFDFRVSPPERLGLPIQEFRLTRDQVSAGLVLNASARSITLLPYDDASNQLPSYLQLSSAVSRVVLEGNTLTGPATVSLIQDRVYDLLVIPVRPFAPKVIIGRPDDLSITLRLDAGTTVSGQALRNDGAPVAGARLVLRNGPRPSTIGVSDAAGDFSLQTREGALSVEISAPAASGLVNAHVSAGGGLVVARNSAPLELAMRWADIPTGRLELTVLGSDGSTPIAGATVRAELTRPIDVAGTLTLHVPGTDASTDVVLQPSGSRVADAITDSSGTVTFPALPEGPYRVVIVPAGSGAADGPAITTATVTLGTGGLTRTVNLSRKIALGGVLLPAAGTKGVRLSALDTGSDIAGATATAVVGDGGRYQLMVNPDRPYKLWAVPAAGQPFARAVVATVAPATSDRTLENATLPAGVVVTSEVRSTVGVADALIQVYCPVTSAVCPDATLPIADTITDIAGRFTVTLPDPRN